MLNLFYLVKKTVPISNEVVPRFDMRDKDGIIFEPIVPRAGERLEARCSVVGRTPESSLSVRWSLDRLNDKKNFFLASNNI